MQKFGSSIFELIVQTSTNLPPDVRSAMGAAMAVEASDSRVGSALDIIAVNIDMAKNCEGPICQDTGTPAFEIQAPVGANQILAVPFHWDKFGAASGLNIVTSKHGLDLQGGKYGPYLAEAHCGLHGRHFDLRLCRMCLKLA